LFVMIKYPLATKGRTVKEHEVSDAAIPVLTWR
jgi:hypothetical protein